MLYEWRSLSAEQRADVNRLRSAYEAAWLPVLQALQNNAGMTLDAALQNHSSAAFAGLADFYSQLQTAVAAPTFAADIGLDLA